MRIAGSCGSSAWARRSTPEASGCRPMLRYASPNWYRTATDRGSMRRAPCSASTRPLSVVASRHAAQYGSSESGSRRRACERSAAGEGLEYAARTYRCASQGGRMPVARRRLPRLPRRMPPGGVADGGLRRHSRCQVGRMPGHRRQAPSRSSRRGMRRSRPRSEGRDSAGLRQAPNERRTGAPTPSRRSSKPGTPFGERVEVEGMRAQRRLRAAPVLEVCGVEAASADPPQRMRAVSSNATRQKS